MASGDSVTDLFALFEGSLIGVAISIVAYAIGAVMHIWIDRHEGKKLIDRYFHTTEKFVGEQIADLKRSLPGSPEIPKVADFVAALPKIEMPTTVSLDPAMIDAIAQRVGASVQQEMKTKLTSTAGIAARKAQSSLERIIEGSIDFGNPYLNGLWHAVPVENKRGLYRRLGDAIRKGGLGELLDGGDENGENDERRPSGLGPEWH
jgi:hypothetical protein